jgi:hypothetical protein
LPVYEQLCLPSEATGVRWWLVLASLQLGDVDAAEVWLEQNPDPLDDATFYRTYGLGVRAEIALVRGEVDAGLAMWREVIDEQDRAWATLAGCDDEPPGLDAWTAEAHSATVIAHAYAGRLDLVAPIVADLPSRLARMLGEAAQNPAPFILELPVCGSLLLALAIADLDRPDGSARTRALGARAVALAERLIYIKVFQPTMSSARARRAAESADQAAYQEAVAAYSPLTREQLRATALDLLADRRP